MEKTPKDLELILKYFNEFSESQIKQLAGLAGLYTEWNQKINVISRKDIDALYERHVLHSLAIAAHVNFQSGLEVIDIGTGGGFPGIPLAIFYPEVRFHLVDSIAKKLKIVEAVVNELELGNVTFQHSRAEDVKGRQFDFAVSRAVAPLKDLWRWSKPLLRKERKVEEFKNGLICLKGGDLSQEIFESGLRPHQVPVADFFEEPFFQEKYLIYQPM
ncbi:MAG: rRNA ((527)-N(7))-methyltransferase RsmG [Bacteroidota bacterium]